MFSDEALSLIHTAPTVDLSANAERRFAAAAVGGRAADTDLEALHGLMCDVIEVLFEIDAALLPPVIRDTVTRA